MRTGFRSVLCGITAFTASLGIGYAVFADPPRPVGYSIVIPVKNTPKNFDINGAGGSIPMPLWNFSVTASAALGGSTYSGTMVGRSPFDNGKTTTTIPTQIIPLIITIVDGSGTHVYDPTVADVCVPGSLTDTAVVTGSPIFTNNNWTMNGISMGNTQYIDAFQRAEFWSQVSGTPYHLILSPTTLAAQSLSFGTGGTSGTLGTNYNAATTFGACGFVGVIQLDDLDAAVQALIKGPLAGQVTPGTFPIFLTRNVFCASSGVNIFSNCCILGYHSGFFSGVNLQIYSPFSVDSAGLFGPGFVSTLSHEMGEAINDPTGNNPTPTWGNIGQVSAGQSNLEVGDPLSPGGIAPTSNQFTVVGANGLTYKLQEMAFYSWFYGGTSLGAAGKYSNNGTLSGNCKLYPPGGTN